MSGYLLDTNALLLLGLAPEAAPPATLARLTEEPRFVSQVCAIEIAIKHSIGKLSLPLPFQTNFAHAFREMARELSADILDIDLGHIAALNHLPLHHRDPFDRLIIAQAVNDDLTIVTRDRTFAAYPGLDLLWI